MASDAGIGLKANADLVRKLPFAVADESLIFNGVPLQNLVTPRFVRLCSVRPTPDVIAAVCATFTPYSRSTGSWKKLQANILRVRDEWLQQVRQSLSYLATTSWPSQLSRLDLCQPCGTRPTRKQKVTFCRWKFCPFCYGRKVRDLFRKYLSPGKTNFRNRIPRHRIEEFVQFVPDDERAGRELRYLHKLQTLRCRDYFDSYSYGFAWTCCEMVDGIESDASGKPYEEGIPQRYFQLRTTCVVFDSRISQCDEKSSETTESYQQLARQFGRALRYPESWLYGNPQYFARVIETTYRQRSLSQFGAKYR